MLKSTMNTRDNIDIKQFLRLRYIIRQNAKYYKPKKSAVLSWENIKTFMNLAPDHIYLATKVIIFIFIVYLTNCFYLLNCSSF